MEIPIELKLVNDVMKNFPKPCSLREVGSSISYSRYSRPFQLEAIMHSEYATYFAKFLEHTNEKKVFIEDIEKIISSRRVRSILDIGAGNGELAIPLARLVRWYMAVESNPLHIVTLEDTGLKVTPEQFPCPVAGTYDFVLASHVLSYQDSNQREFVECAFEKVGERGALLIITFRGNEADHWTQLVDALGIPVHEQYKAGYEALVGIVREITNDFVIRKVRTEVRTDTFDDMAQALAFVASDGVADAANAFLEKRELLKTILDEQYRDGDQYVFPFDHFFIQMTK